MCIRDSDISEADMGYALVIDSIDYSLWVMFLLRVIQLAPKFNKWTKADTSKLDEVSSRLEEEAKLNTKPITFQSLILLLGSAFLVSAIATNVGNKLYALTILPICIRPYEVFVDCAAKGTDYSFCVHWMLISALRI